MDLESVSSHARPVDADSFAAGRRLKRKLVTKRAVYKVAYNFVEL